jgi:arylsulfatase A-like enzyme/tetratricopeptide (TPR) repeat protein
MKLRWFIPCLAVLAACSPGDPKAVSESGGFVPKGRPSILLITLDTTRADHLEPYGATNVQTPALSGLADRGIVFENAVATAPVTGPTHASLLTGLYPRRHGVRNNLTHHLSDDVPTLAEWLSATGYRTAAFVSAVVLEGRYGFDQGFELYDDDLKANSASRQMRRITERPAKVTAERALAWLDALDDDQPYFLWVHFYDPHLPWSPPSPWAERYRGRPYDGEIAFMDSQVGRLLRHPRAAGDDVMVAAIGDHGEGLGEHGEKAHGLLVYESTIRVPWILTLPGGPSGVRIATPISQVDLVPTIAEMVTPSPTVDFEGLEGRSLLPLLRGDDWTAERMLFAEAELPFFTYGWSRLRSVRQGSLKYIDAPVAELYDLDHDPDESTNLAEAHGSDVQRLAMEVETWSAIDDDPGGLSPVDAKTAEMLRALGYSAGDPGRPEGEGQGNPVELISVHEELQEIHRLMVEGQFVEAVAGVRGVLQRDPENLSALRDLSRGLLNLGRLDEAADVAATASAVAPWSAQALQVEADIEYRRGQDERALELIDQSLELDPRFLQARLDRIRYLAALNREEEAIEEIEPLLEESPDDPLVAIRFVEVVEFPAGNFRAAEERLRSALSRDPYLVEGWLLLAKVLRSEGRQTDAVAVYREALGHQGESSDLQNRLALLLADLADPTADLALGEAIRSSPVVRADLHVALGERLAARGRREEARRQFEIAANAPTFSAATRNSRGMALLQLGRAAEAEITWREVIRDYPEFGRAWLNLSSLSIQRRNWAEVERFARVAVEREPFSAAAWNNLAIGLEELGQKAEAEAAYRRASEVDSRDYRALFNLGILLRKSARYDEAAAVQQEVLTRNPAHSGAHFELGMLFAGPLGDPAGAKVHLQATIAADPNHPRARQARTVLDQLP